VFAVLTTIITVLLTFVLTSIVGNRVVHSWQQHNWLGQRRILEAEEQYKALHKTFDEVSELAGKRQHRMFRLLSGIRHGKNDILQKRLADYDEASLAWNERLSTSYAKLTMQLNYQLSLRLETRIQRRFVELDAELTSLTTAKLKDAKKMSATDFARLSKALSTLHGEIVNFNKATLKDIEEKKGILYEADLNPRTLYDFPTWELFKALFKPRKHSFDKF
jgi:hypothetical protein